MCGQLVVRSTIQSPLEIFDKKPELFICLRLNENAEPAEGRGIPLGEIPKQPDRSGVDHNSEVLEVHSSLVGLHGVF